MRKSRRRRRRLFSFTSPQEKSRELNYEECRAPKLFPPLDNGKKCHHYQHHHLCALLSSRFPIFAALKHLLDLLIDLSFSWPRKKESNNFWLAVIILIWASWMMLSFNFNSCMKCKRKKKYPIQFYYCHIESWIIQHFARILALHERIVEFCGRCNSSSRFFP